MRQLRNGASHPSAALGSRSRRVGRPPTALLAAITAVALLTSASGPDASGRAGGAAGPDGQPAATGSPEDGRTTAIDLAAWGGLLRSERRSPAAAELPAGDDGAPSGNATGWPDDGPGDDAAGRPGGGLDDEEVLPADLVLHLADGEFDLAALDGPLAGARHVAPATRLTAATSTGADDRELEVMGVDGATFRPLTPEVTATADAVWARLGDGDVLVGHELAEELDLELGGPLVLATDVATVTARVGAFAANGTPAYADVLVPTALAERLGAGGPNTLVVAAGEGDPADLADALETATGGEVELRREPAAPVAGERTSEPTRTGGIEPFSYTSRADGRIDIHGDWVARNIVPVRLPGMAATSCHRVMVPQLQAVVDELLERGLYDRLDPSQFAGCFVARHIDWDPARPLSMHAWGLAIDLNVRDNPLGATPTMDPQVVEVFERWGFDWGGRWQRPDGMHFELARIVPTG